MPSRRCLPGFSHVRQGEVSSCASRISTSAARTPLLRKAFSMTCVGLVSIGMMILSCRPDVCTHTRKPLSVSVRRWSSIPAFARVPICMLPRPHTPRMARRCMRVPVTVWTRLSATRVRQRSVTRCACMCPTRRFPSSMKSRVLMSRILQASAGISSCVAATVSSHTSLSASSMISPRA